MDRLSTGYKNNKRAQEFYSCKDEFAILPRWLAGNRKNPARARGGCEWYRAKAADIKEATTAMENTVLDIEVR